MESTPVTLVVRERIGAMSRYGKSLWSEDARRPFPLEPAQWSRIDRLGDAVSLVEFGQCSWNKLDLLVRRFDLTTTGKK